MIGQFSLMFKKALVRGTILGALALAAMTAGAVQPTPARADGVHIGIYGFGFSAGPGYRGHRYRGPVIYAPAPRYYYYPRRSRAYVVPRHRGRVPYSKTGLRPFTPHWYAYCARKFKSFNPRTGTYLAYSGRYRYCR